MAGRLPRQWRVAYWKPAHELSPKTRKPITKHWSHHARIIVLDELSADGLNLLKSAGNIEVLVRTGLKGAELRSALLEADGAICRSGVKITAEALQGNHRLRAMAGAGVGVDNIDTPAATGKASWS